MLKSINRCLGKNLRVLIWVITLAWTVLMLYLLLSPGGDFKSLFFNRNADKLYHAIVFYFWSLAVFLSVRSTKAMVSGITILSIGSFLAIGTELLQHVIPRRTPEFLDAFSDILGCVLGILTGFLIKKEVKR